MTNPNMVLVQTRCRLFKMMRPFPEEKKEIFYKVFDTEEDPLDSMIIPKGAFVHEEVFAEEVPNLGGDLLLKKSTWEMVDSIMSAYCVGEKIDAESFGVSLCFF